MACAVLDGQSTYRTLNSPDRLRRALPTQARNSSRAIPAMTYSVRFPTYEFRSALANLKFIKYLRFSFPNSRLPEGLRRRIYLAILQMRERKAQLQIRFPKWQPRPAASRPECSLKKSNRKKAPEHCGRRHRTESWGPAGVREAILGKPLRGRPRPPGSQS